MSELNDPIVELLDTARALRVLALGLDGEEGEGTVLPQGGKAGLACLLRLLSEHVEGCAQRLDDAQR
ncbi:hypothetical protein [Desulfovibrio falkowii]|uniref:Uncharacterized protein n=1 Tax=Desulfovibrio falkowii TaxID=3136602 RepID=A0ABQ0EAW2_9BACT